MRNTAPREKRPWPHKLRSSRTASTRCYPPDPQQNQAKSASLNALTHGATSTRRILPGESEHAFQQLVAALTTHYRPQSDWEHELIERIADADWRKKRILRTETAFFSTRVQDITEAMPELAGHPDKALAQLFIQPEEMKKAGLMLRYIAAATRACAKAVSDFEQAVRHREETGPATPMASQQRQRTAELHSTEEPLAAKEPEAPAEAATQKPAQRTGKPVHEMPKPSAHSEPRLSRTERRAIERARRKAEKKALKANGFVSQTRVPTQPAIPAAA